jgi:hypothetical protein
MKKTNTPLTDEQVLAYRSEDGSEFVFASFAEELETKLAASNKRLADCEFLLEHRYKIIQRQEPRCNEAIARAEKAEARLDFLIVHGGDYVGYAETWNVSIEDIDADMAAKVNFNK